LGELIEAVSERAATAMEGIADLLEQAHVALRQRLQGAPDQTPAPALPDQEPAPARNGRIPCCSLFCLTELKKSVENLQLRTFPSPAGQAVGKPPCSRWRSTTQRTLLLAGTRHQACAPSWDAADELQILARPPAGFPGTD
jgi:hypothetical protein